MAVGVTYSRPLAPGMRNLSNPMADVDYGAACSGLVDMSRCWADGPVAPSMGDSMGCLPDNAAGNML